MKNTTGQETTYPVLPSLRVAFKHDEAIEEKAGQNGKSKKPGQKSKVQPSKKDSPQFNDYRIKAKDHDPL